MAVKKRSLWKNLWFWFFWSLLLLPAYVAAAGTWIIGSLLPAYHDLIDIVLTIVFAATLVILMMLAVYTAWHYSFRTRPDRHLLMLVMVGVLLVPVVSAGIAMSFYVQLNNIDIAAMLEAAKAQQGG
ncbi:MAG: hypothetical protein CR991_02830 [Proteobacteria bacterium]|nr:MAG: hypothetical protein CR991_02830 [Pseudomonadota bacterium]